MNAKISLILLFIVALLPAAFAQEAEKAKQSDEDTRFLVTNFNHYLLNPVKAEYPKAARDAGLTGSVQLWIEVNKNGEVTSAKLVSGAEQFAESALAAARLSKFKPYDFNGKIYKSTGILTLYFPDTREKEATEQFNAFLLGTRINSGFTGVFGLGGGWAEDVNAIDPAIIKEVEGDIKGVPPEKFMEVLIAGTNTRIKKKMTGEKLWYFELGEKMGRVIFEGVMNESKAVPRSEQSMRKILSDIKEHSKTLPPGFPHFAEKSLKQLVGQLERKELVSDEARKQIVDKWEEVFDFIDRQIPR